MNRLPVGAEFVENYVDSASFMLSKDSFKEVLFILSKLHFRHDVSISSCFDWLLEAAIRTGDDEILNKAKSIRRYLIENRGLGERFVINSW